MAIKLACSGLLPVFHFIAGWSRIVSTLIRMDSAALTSIIKILDGDRRFWPTWRDYVWGGSWVLWSMLAIGLTCSGLSLLSDNVVREGRGFTLMGQS